ncbi:polysaccharide deacetylase family protein [Bifidobacterium callimiconis]|uniref:Polysaccharide deacetylase n=1 Tax=Bifidobacterium callimiconis TaxID=2306973 RepID=A0A430F9D9_9BIFI|nr:polysaccharide deacetylase family protein [Bifidobacterium callimiconis]RSX49445.1 polysaccharide deacetylase [Bifidobacterium callimiconis]
MASPNDRANDGDVNNETMGQPAERGGHQTPEHVEELHFGGSARGAYYDDAGNPRQRGFFWRFSRAAREEAQEKAHEQAVRNERESQGPQAEREPAGRPEIVDPVKTAQPKATETTGPRTRDVFADDAVARGESVRGPVPAQAKSAKSVPAESAPAAPKPAPAPRPAAPRRISLPVFQPSSEPTPSARSAQSAQSAQSIPESPATAKAAISTALAPHGWTVARKCVVIVLTMVIVAAATCTGFWMWENRLRPITVTVNGEQVNTRINTSIATLLSHSDGFGTKAGRMLSVTGKTLDENGGERYSVTLGSTAIKSSDLAATRLTDGDALFVKDGKDVTEPHTVIKAAIPFGNDINLKGGGTIQYVEQQGVDGVKEQWVGKKSKETADKKVLKEPVNFKVTTKSPNPQDGKKYIALTFDDGPSKYTQDILNILNEKGVHATFFNLSEQGTEFPDQEKAVAAAGNEVASHSVSHKYLPKLSRDDLRNEINNSFAPIAANTGATGRMFRSPYGAFEAQQWVDSTDLISMNVLWSIDTEDWRRPGPDKIHDAVLNHAKNGSIVLMHDGGGDRSQDVDALPRIIDDLKNEGFTFVTVSELIKLDGTFPQHVTENQPVPAAANDTTSASASASAKSKPSATKSTTATTK